MRLLPWLNSPDPETLLNKKFTKEHEEKSKTHAREFQERLDDLVGLARDPNDLQPLKDHLTIQIQIEELILKSRMSEHTKMQAYAPFVVPLVIALMGLIIGYFSRKC